MLSHELGFVSSWKMLTRDKGWIKPLLVLTLVSWIPILGQIAVLGYGLEWARLTAWGVDSAPKQRGVKYGKVLTTGGIALLVTITMGIVLGILNVLLFGGAYVGAAFPLFMGMTVTGVLDSLGTSLLWGGFSLFPLLLMMVVNVFFGTFISAAMMRATVYDSFSAGWRVDRLAQMVGRDVGGFFHTYAVSLIGGLVSGIVSGLVAFVGMLFLGVGAFTLAYGMPTDGFSYDFGYVLLHMGAFPILMFVLLAIVALFAVQVVGVAMQLVSINAVGQWFCRFDVNRWGVSSAPLPHDVPRTGSGVPGAAVPAAPEAPAAEPVAAPPVEPVSGAPVDSASDAAPVDDVAHVVETATPMPAVTEIDAETAEEAARFASEQTGTAHADNPAGDASAPANSPEITEPVAEKKPIPLGPISDGSQDQIDEDGPIQV